MTWMTEAEEPANPQLIVAGREALGLTQADLADRLTRIAGASRRISQGYVSRVEKGDLAVSGDRLAAFASALELTPDMLSSDFKLWALGDGCLYHRNRRSTKASTLRKLHARVNLLRIHLHRLTKLIGYTLPVFAFTPIRVGQLHGPEDAARVMRAKFDLGPGAIDSVTALAERLGAFVVPISLGSREVDATSLHPPGEPPLFVINTDAPVDRQRFTLAHEIGHCACVPESAIDVEDMAQSFAAELLAPTHELYEQLAAKPINPSRLLEMKPVWRMSAAALLRRAFDLAVITESRYRSINAQISALGWQTAEPEPLPPERSTVVPRIIATAVSVAGSVDAAAMAAGTTASKMQELFGDALLTRSIPGTVNE